MSKESTGHPGGSSGVTGCYSSTVLAFLCRIWSKKVIARRSKLAQVPALALIISRKRPYTVMRMQRFSGISSPRIGSQRLNSFGGFMTRRKHFMAI